MGEIIMYYPDILRDLSDSVAFRLKDKVDREMAFELKERTWMLLRYEEVEDKVFNMHYEDK